MFSVELKSKKSRLEGIELTFFPKALLFKLLNVFLAQVGLTNPKIGYRINLFISSQIEEHEASKIHFHVDQDYLFFIGIIPLLNNTVA